MFVVRLSSISGGCDCCGRDRYLHQVWASGTETWACNECLGWDPYEDEDRDLEFQSQIDSMTETPP